MAVEPIKKKVAQDVQGFFSDFWKFAAKGNIVDLAVGVVVGNAFTAVVNSLVSDLITPFISLVSPSSNLTTWQYTLQATSTSATGKPIPSIIINYGHFVQTIVNFLIIALSIFIFIKIFARLRERVVNKEEAEQKAAPPDPVSTQEKLLSEIRDLLKEQVDDKTPKSS